MSKTVYRQFVKFIFECLKTQLRVRLDIFIGVSKSIVIGTTIDRDLDIM